MVIAHNEGGTPMAAIAATRQRLARRSTDGIEVSPPFWSKRTNQVTDEVFDEPHRSPKEANVMNRLRGAWHFIIDRPLA
jgi:hypothetical protein